MILPLLFLGIFISGPVHSWGDGLPSDEKRGDEKKNQWRVLPFVFYTPETKIAGGVGGIYYLRSLPGREGSHPSTLSMNLIYTQRKQLILGIAPDLFLGRGKFHLTGQLEVKRYVEKFYGIGAQTPEEAEEDYSFRSLALQLSLRQRISRGFYGGIQFDFGKSHITEVGPGGILDSEDIVGNDGGRVSGLGFVLVQDSRDNIFFPTRGTYLQFQTSIFIRALGSEFNFHKYKIDCRQYMEAFSSHVLALRINIDLSSGNVPFQWLPMLGGPSAMRGYIQGRFRDKHAISLQAEYRVPLFWRLTAAGFMGWGDVADRLKKLKLFAFKMNGGLGIRYRIDSRSGTNVRLDFGFAKDSFTVYAMINEAF